MSVKQVTLEVTGGMEIAGVEINAGDYTGYRLDRADMNAPGGKRVSYQIEMPRPWNPPLPATGRVDVTKHVEAGAIRDLGA